MQTFRVNPYLVIVALTLAPSSLALAAPEESANASPREIRDDVADGSDEEPTVAARNTRVRNAPWVRRLPPSLRARGPLDLLYVDWVALALLIPAAIFLSIVAFMPLRRLVRSISKRTATPLDDTLAPAIAPYARGLLALGIFHLGVAELSIPRKVAARIEGVERFVLVAFLVFGFLRVVRAVGETALRSDWAQKSPSSRSLVPIAMRAGDVFAWVAAFLALLSMMGFDIGGLLTGLGVGGVIVALAAQKTVENILGAFALGIDQPMREGDSIFVDGRVGTVERIGLRSTRIRTLDRTVVCIPNARLADMSIESYAARDRVRVYALIGLVYDTPPETVRRIRDAIAALLRAQPGLASDPIIVRLKSLGATSLELEVAAWFEATSYADLAEVRETALLEIMQAVRDNGGEFAVPLRPVLGGAPALAEVASPLATAPTR
jgi:MscS family membrane protein